MALWRVSKTSSTDVGTILGVNPYKSIHKLYREKMGLETSTFRSPAAQRGIDLEPLAREWAQIQSGMVFKSICIEREDNPRHAASLDGYDYLSDVLLEVKCCGPANHAKLLEGDVPPPIPLPNAMGSLCLSSFLCPTLCL